MIVDGEKDRDRYKHAEGKAKTKGKFGLMQHIPLNEDSETRCIMFAAAQPAKPMRD